MGGYHTEHQSKYGFEPTYGNPIGPYVSSSQISLALDARTANQLKETSAKLSSGSKAIEVQLTFPQVAESIPDTHLEEINRLRKLVGADLTVHGVLVDPTGVGEGRWDETRREHAERQLWSSLQRAHKVNPEGNVVVTFHTSNGLPEPETRIWDEGKKEDKVIKLSVINDRTGEIAQLPVPREDYLISPGKEKSAHKELDRINRERWLSELTQITIDLRRAKEAFSEIAQLNRGAFKEGEEGKMIEQEKKAYERYNLYKSKPEVYQELGKVAAESGGSDHVLKLQRAETEAIGQADIWVRDAFNRFKELYGQAYEAANKLPNKEEIIPQLQQLGDRIRKEVDKEKEYIADYTHLRNFADTITEGVEKLNAFFEKTPPQVYRPLKEFAIDRAAETFSNLAVQAYNEFGATSPVISIENPPAGSGISRADDMKLLIDESRNRFVDKMVEQGASKSEAEDQARKLIGATWDVGHINMIRKYGFGNKELIKETETIAPYVKNIHLSDNFGIEHTELPMGMGNVPMQGHLAALKEAHGEKLKKIKQIIETGNWYQHFQVSPYAETLAAFGSPIYSSSMTPAWNQAKDFLGGGYFSGYGMNPDIHHSLYGSGFSTLPVELGGQIAGRSRMSGAPIE
ncbi:hypothetical protein HYZ97_05000 [Candidatus Pacearchaeota archaeon]|nr:hypothetical protein [Candidatus Pacearchaeota archaeon]